VAERGPEGIEQVRVLTGGDGTPAVLECVGTRQPIEMAIGVVRDGGVISRVGAPSQRGADGLRHPDAQPGWPQERVGAPQGRPSATRGKPPPLVGRQSVAVPCQEDGTPVGLLAQLERGTRRMIGSSRSVARW
jgi:hypothetical protein